MAAATTRAAKQALRKSMKQVLSTITPETRLIKSSNVARKVLEHRLYKNCKRIAVYLSLPNEVETDFLIKDIFNTNRVCFIPQYDTESRHMDMIQLYSLQDLEELPLTKWNVKQPADSDRSRPNALDTGGLDLILIPGLAFTVAGNRLGRGKGYYDTFLNQHKSRLGKCPPTMALAFKEQVVDKIPTDDHDYVIDTLISD